MYTITHTYGDKEVTLRSIWTIEDATFMCTDRVKTYGGTALVEDCIGRLLFKVTMQPVVVFDITKEI